MRPWESQKAWIQLDEASQVSRAQYALTNCCIYLNIPIPVVVGIKDNDRFVLSYEQDPEKNDFAKSMIKLETLMRQTMGVVIDLRLESKEDKNKRAGRNGRE